MASKTKIKVIKRDDTSEDFQPKKIERVTQAAGLTPEEAKKLSSKVAQWIKTQNHPQVTTLQIKEEVIEELTKINDFATNSYTWYQKTKDKGLNSGESE